MNVLIVAKTRMKNPYLCVGGLDLETNQGLRLLQSNGSNQLANTRFNVGEIWDIDYVPKKEVEPPHIEDVIVQRSKFMRTQIETKEFLKYDKEHLVEAFMKVSTANISDAMHRTGELRGLNPVWVGEPGELKFAGPAVTVRTYNGDWSAPVQAIDHAKPRAQWRSHKR